MFNMTRKNISSSEVLSSKQDDKCSYHPAKQRFVKKKIKTPNKHFVFTFLRAILGIINFFFFFCFIALCVCLYIYVWNWNGFGEEIPCERIPYLLSNFIYSFILSEAITNICTCSKFWTSCTFYFVPVLSLCEVTGLILKTYYTNNSRTVLNSC